MAPKKKSKIKEGLFDMVMGRYINEVLANIGDDLWLYSKKRKAFWLSVRLEYGDAPYYRSLYYKVCYRLRKYKNKGLLRQMRHVRMMGFIPIVEDGKIVTVYNQIKFNPGRLQSRLHSESEQKEEGNDFVTMIPYSMVRSFKDDDRLMLELKEVDSRLRQHFSNETTRQNGAHRGVSLGYTVVSGGCYADAKKGISGSFHMNQNLLCDPRLQRDVIRVCCLVLNKAYGGTRWYKNLLKYFDRPENLEKKEHLLPNTPCTNIWWSTDGRDSNEHCDWNAYGASFLFCPDNYKSGAITLRHDDMPEVKVETLLEAGEVFAGRWARSPHSNRYGGDTGDDGDDDTGDDDTGDDDTGDDDTGAVEGRTSFVMYCDSRIVTDEYTYLCVVNEPFDIVKGINRREVLAHSKKYRK
jgi:hypothetical protein